MEKLVARTLYTRLFCQPLIWRFTEGIRGDVGISREGAKQIQAIPETSP